MLATDQRSTTSLVKACRVSTQPILYLQEGVLPCWFLSPVILKDVIMASLYHYDFIFCIKLFFPVYCLSVLFNFSLLHFLPRVFFSYYLYNVNAEYCFIFGVIIIIFWRLCTSGIHHLFVYPSKHHRITNWLCI